jgi:hypothetical protein
VWIAEYAAPYSGTPGQLEEMPRRWRIMSPEGAWLGVVDIPAGLALDVLAVTPTGPLAVEKDSLGVNAVSVYRRIGGSGR